MCSEEEIKNKFQFYVEEGGIIRIKILEPPEDADEYVPQAVLGKNCVSKVCLKNEQRL